MTRAKTPAASPNNTAFRPSAPPTIPHGVACPLSTVRIPSNA